MGRTATTASSAVAYLQIVTFLTLETESSIDVLVAAVGATQHAHGAAHHAALLAKQPRHLQARE